MNKQTVQDALNCENTVRTMQAMLDKGKTINIFLQEKKFIVIENNTVNSREQSQHKAPSSTQRSSDEERTHHTKYDALDGVLKDGFKESNKVDVRTLTITVVPLTIA